MATALEHPSTPGPMEDSRRCHARTSAGNPCRKFAIRGATVCGTHGGSAPQVKAKAQQRLLEAADPAAAMLVHLALNGENETVRLNAARDILDRAGLSPKQLIEATVTHHDGDSELDRSIAELLDAIARQDTE